MAGRRSVTIDVVSDVICPWCFIGKRRMEKALADLAGEFEVEVSWLPFQLNPDMPVEGVDRTGYRKAKFGSLEKSRARDEAVAAEGAGEGIAFAFERIRRTPNTFAAHQLIDLAQQEGVGGAVVEALFGAYFLEARDIGDRKVLASIAEACGLERGLLEARWADKAEAQRVAREERSMRELGISGVPTFIIADRYGVSGAQPPHVLADAVREAAGSLEEG
jgi:predicted DsbA family dithiol-disulfide isomerase